jgi:hypothetical protein
MKLTGHCRWYRASYFTCENFNSVLYTCFKKSGKPVGSSCNVNLIGVLDFYIWKHANNTGLGGGCKLIFTSNGR